MANDRLPTMREHRQSVVDSFKIPPDSFQGRIMRMLGNRPEEPASVPSPAIPPPVYEQNPDLGIEQTQAANLADPEKAARLQAVNEASRRFQEMQRQKLMQNPAIQQRFNGRE